jgi:hypothetical protein
MARKIAIIWDFDKTLISGYMQAPLFEHYGVNPIQFWDEVNALPGYHRNAGVETLASDFLYLNHMLTYVRRGLFPGLNNARLRAFGAKQHLAAGIPAFFKNLQSFVRKEAIFQQADIEVEHYVISTGLRQIVLGSSVAPHMRFIWGCEFLEYEAPPGFLRSEKKKDDRRALTEEVVIHDIGYVIDHTTKTRAIFEINKGSREPDGVHVNAKIERSMRRVPFENMIYIADGVSDIPSLSVVAQSGGRTFGVYQPNSPRDFAQAQLLLEQERVEAIGPADYSVGTTTHSWILSTLMKIAQRLINTPKRDVQVAPIPPTPTHIYDYRDK